MDGHADYMSLADQADRLADQAPDHRIAGSWRRIATGLRALARLRGAARRRWRGRTDGRDSHDGRPLSF